MKDIKAYDYEDVNVAVNEKYISYEQEVTDPDLSFALGTLTAKLPIIVYYEDPENKSHFETIARKYGVITAGPPNSMIPLSLLAIDDIKDAKLKPAYKLFERFDTLRAESVQEMRVLTDEAQALIVGCSISARHSLAIANELQLAAAVLIGPTQAETTRRIESVGMNVPRVSLIEEISNGTDVPVIATASSSMDVCKALVAGASAALIHFGGPFDPNDDLDFVLKSVTDAMRENLTELCRSSGAKKASDLTIRCSLVKK